MRRIKCWIRKLTCKVLGHKQVWSLGGRGPFITCSRCWAWSRDLTDGERDALRRDFEERMARKEKTE